MAERWTPTLADIRQLARAKGFDFNAHEDKGSPLGAKLSCCIFEPSDPFMPLLEFQAWGSTRAIRNRRALAVVQRMSVRRLHLEGKHQ